MSNWLKAKCQTLENIESAYMEEAFARMGLYADFDTHSVGRVYDDDEKPCHALLRRIDDNTSARIGLNFEITTGKNGETTTKMTAEADWWGISYDETSFMEEFTIEYITVKATAKAREQGFTVREEKELEDGRRRIVLARAA